MNGDSCKSFLELACPLSIQRQISWLCAEIQNICGKSIIGIYLHGSLALGGFNPRRSDLDLLVVTRWKIPLAQKQALAEALLDCSLQPAPIEIHFLVASDLHPWRYPPRFDLHYSETWRERFLRELASSAWQAWDDEIHLDRDLGAHIFIVHKRGILLIGPPPEQVFPEAPRSDYLAAISYDLRDGIENIADNPIYFILNACRTLAYIITGQILSKQAGGEWGLAHLPVELRPAVRIALAKYQDDSPERCFTDQELAAFSVLILEILNQI